jgi:hypothetical protein
VLLAKLGLVPAGETPQAPPVPGWLLLSQLLFYLFL